MGEAAEKTGDGTPRETTQEEHDSTPSENTNNNKKHIFQKMTSEILTQHEIHISVLTLLLFLILAIRLGDIPVSFVTSNYLRGAILCV